MFSIFPRPRKARQFEYRPLYYDPVKEEMEARRRELLGEDAESPYKEYQHNGEYRPGERIREMRIRRGVVAERAKAETRRGGMTRLLIFLVLLGIIIFFITRA